MANLFHTFRENVITANKLLLEMRERVRCSAMADTSHISNSRRAIDESWELMRRFDELKSDARKPVARP